MEPTRYALTSYRYDPYGHPPNLTTLGDENPFGYQGAYTAGIQANGVTCSGPNQNTGLYYDAEDGRFTQSRFQDFFQDLIRSSPQLQDLDTIGQSHERAVDAHDGGDGILDYFSKNRLGRFVSGCVGGGATAGGVILGTGAVTVPLYGQVTAGLAALGGCVVGGGMNAETGINPITTR